MDGSGCLCSCSAGGEFGVKLDGENDQVRVTGSAAESAASSYAGDGTFAISMWFTRKVLIFCISFSNSP